MGVHSMKIFDDKTGIDKLTINGMTMHSTEDTFDLPKDDMVNHPPHYNQYGVECIDALRAATGEGFEYYLQGNAINNSRYQLAFFKSSTPFLYRYLHRYFITLPCR